MAKPRLSGSVPARRSSSKGKGKGGGKSISLDDHEPLRRPFVDRRHCELRKALMNEVLETSPGVSWDAIAGLDEVKRLFWEIVVAPVRTRGWRV